MRSKIINLLRAVLGRRQMSQENAFRRWCIMGENSVFHPEAEIFNNFYKKENIVIGNNTHIRGQLLTFGHGGKIEIGDYCYIGRNTYVMSAVSICMGNRVLISHNCNIFDSDTHPINAVERHNQFKAIITTGFPKESHLDEQPIILNDDVWVGANSTILKGITLGRGAIVAAGSVVTKDVPDWTVVAGNPAKVIKVIPENDRA